MANSLINEMDLYEIRVAPIVPEMMLALSSPLYDIESSNTTESRVKAISTTEGNRFEVIETSSESLIETVIPEGNLALYTPVENTKKSRNALITITLKR